MDSALAQPLTLKCGLTLKNRLVKAAMAELMAGKNNLPNALHNNLYREWARGGWGMVITGNVQIDNKFLGQPGDCTINNEHSLKSAWESWAKASTTEGTPVIMQMNHPGRQSPVGAGARSICEKTIAPSSIPIDLGGGIIARSASALFFGTPRTMTQSDIDTVINQFVSCAVLASETGFNGVEIHAAHGYLLAQYLSAKTNVRTDEYGGSAGNRAKIVVDIINAVREAVPKSFCIGIKLNSVDHQSAWDLGEFIQQLDMIVDAGVDFVDISGGTFEDPTMISGNVQSQKSARTVGREAFFLEFAEAIRRRFRHVPLMVTGGFRTRVGMMRAVEEDACDMIGIGRPAVLEPKLPTRIILNADLPDGQAKLATEKRDSSWLVKLTGIKSVGSGAESAWYSKKMAERGRAAAAAGA